jgi:hypothetical protein
MKSTHYTNDGPAVNIQERQPIVLQSACNVRGATRGSDPSLLTGSSRGPDLPSSKRVSDDSVQEGDRGCVGYRFRRSK